MKRFVVMVRENYPGAQITEHCRCHTHDAALAKAADLARTIVTGRYFRMPKYNLVEVADLGPPLMLKPSITGARKMQNPDKNVRPPVKNAFGADIAGNLLLVCKQIDAYKMLQPRADHGQQATSGAAAQERPALPQRQPEADQ